MTFWINGTGSLVLTERHSGGNASFTLVPSDGLDYLVSFPDGSSCVVPAAGISLTISSGATLGVANPNVAFKLWFALFNSGGVPVLAVRNCLSLAQGSAGPTFQILAPPEQFTYTTTVMSSGSDSSHVFYSGVLVTASPFVWLDFAPYEAGLPSIGTWSSSPTSISPVLPSTPRPGSTVQMSSNFTLTTASLSVASTFVNTSLTTQISPLSASNLIEAGIDSGFTTLNTAAPSADAQVFLNRNNSFGVANALAFNGASTGIQFAWTLHGFDAPNSTSPQTYGWQCDNYSGGNMNFSADGIWAREIMT
jgi:hypothetical protein